MASCQVSNIIYLDSPAGVGFSYANTTIAYDTGDKETALDSHTFLFKVEEINMNKEADEL